MSRFQITRSGALKTMVGAVSCALLGSAFVQGAMAQSSPPDPCTVSGKACKFGISNTNIEKVTPLFKLQAQISQAKIPVGDAVFSKLNVNILSGATQLCTEAFSDVKVRSGVLNLEVGRAVNCNLEDVIGKYNDLGFQVCIGDAGNANCLKAIQMESVPYSVKATYATQAQSAYRAEIASRSQYSQRLTADSNMLVNTDGSTNLGSGFFDVQTPGLNGVTGTIDALTSVFPSLAGDVSGSFFYWSPTSADTNAKVINLTSRNMATTNLEPLTRFMVHAANTNLWGKLWVGDTSWLDKRATLNGGLTVTPGGDTQVQSFATFSAPVHFTGSAPFADDAQATFNAAVTVSNTGTLTANGASTFNATSQFNAPVNASSAAPITAAGTATFNNTVNVNGVTNLNNAATIGTGAGNTLTVNSTANMQGPATFNGTAAFKNKVDLGTASTAVNVIGTSTFSNNANFTSGTTTFQTGTTVDMTNATVKLPATASVNGMTVGGASTFNGAATFNKSVTLGSGAGNTLTVNQPSTFNTSATILGPVSITGTGPAAVLSVAGPANFTNGITIGTGPGAALTMKGDAVFQTGTTIDMRNAKVKLPATQRTYSGNLCHAVNTTDAESFSYSQYGIQNNGGAALRVLCPLPMSAVGSAQDVVSTVTVTGYDRSTTQDISCSLQQLGTDGNFLTTPVTQGTSSWDWAPKTITFSNMSPAVLTSSTLLLDCTLPAVETGFSHITSISISSNTQ